MAIKTPLAPHPIHYEQHRRRRRSSLVIPAFDACRACPGNTKLAAVARIPKARRAPRSRLPLHTGPTALHRAPSFQILPPTDASSQAQRQQGWPSFRAGLPVSHRQGRVHSSHSPRPPTAAIRQFHMLLSEICPRPLSRLPCQACSSNMSIAVQDCALKIVTLCLLCSCQLVASHHLWWPGGGYGTDRDRTTGLCWLSD